MIDKETWKELIDWIENGFNKEFIDVYDDREDCCSSSFGDGKILRGTCFNFSKIFEENSDVDWNDETTWEQRENAYKSLRIGQKGVAFTELSNSTTFLDIVVKSLEMKNNELQISFYDKSKRFNQLKKLSKDEFGEYLTKKVDAFCSKWLEDTTYYPKNSEKLTKAYEVTKTLTPEEVKYLKEQYYQAIGPKKMSDFVLEYDKNRQQEKNMKKSKDKAKEQELERER